MDFSRTQLTDKGLLVLSRAGGGIFKVNDRVLVDTFESLDEDKDKKSGTIVKIWYEIFSTGRRELADVLFKHSGETKKGLFTMFMEQLFTNRSGKGDSNGE